MIRPAAVRDHAAIARVVRAAFGPDEDIPGLVEHIRAAGAWLELVATAGDDVVGHVMLSAFGLDEHEVLQLSPLAVAPAHQRRGIGSTLVEACIARADEAGEPMLLVEGDPRYYRRFGFERASEHAIVAPEGVPDFALQVRRLGAWDGRGGRVRYPAHFAPFV